MRYHSLVALATNILTLSITQVAALDELEGYAFAYFTGNSIEGENIYFAATNGNDALSWKELNGGQPVLKSQYGTKGLRDPFIIRSHDGTRFWIIATDLSIGSGTAWGDAVRTGSRYIEVWESEDLVNWSDQRHILVSPETAGMTWAPEAYYDDELGTYLVFWASALYEESDTNHTGSTYHRMMYATTDDFVTFSEPVIWQDNGSSRIDSTVLKNSGVYYRFTKDEGSVTGCADIIQEHATTLSAGVDSWTTDASCIGANAGSQAVEGPTIFKANPNDAHGEKFYLFVDEYGGRGYIPLETEDIANPDWKVSADYSLPSSPRHGTVLPITKAELERFTAAYSTSASRRSIGTKRQAKEERVSLVKRDSPVLKGLYADPNIAVFGCNYYIYATTDGFEGWGGNVFYVWKSPDLVEWTRADEPFLTLDGENGNVPWANGNAWAPTIAERDGKYYFYFSGNNPSLDNTKTIGVAVAESPEGPFTAQEKAMITGQESVSSGTIDPATFHDPVSGKYYFLWGNGSPVIAELNDDMISINWDTASFISGLEDFREGIFLNYRDGVYHLTYAIDDTRSENYRVGYATASDPYGPYTYHGLILQKDEAQGILGTGHSSIINVPGTDDWYIAYHRFAIPNGNGTNRETTIDKLEFDTETGLIKPVTPTLSSVAAQTVPYCS
ncbi:glycosyl hydrolases family 43 domain-containing protein [Sarocladium implicatum]|nr:glycosyl hydrolases family 43 domain-containing protein [Sarocladium implicatum]